MRVHSFKLTTEGVNPPFIDGPEPDSVSVPLLGHKVTVKKGDQVCFATSIGVHPDPRRGDVHTPIDGIVTQITPQAVTIKKDDSAEVTGTCPMPRNLSELEGPELGAALKSLGLGMREFSKPGDHIIINGFNPEPGITWAGGIFGNYLRAMQTAVDVIRRLMRPSQISVVLPEGSKKNLGNLVRHFYAKPLYPNSISELIVRIVTGQERPRGVACVNLHTLWRYGMVATSGMPALHTVMTVQDKNYVVMPGTSIRDILTHAGIFPQDGDYVILGGYMRGTAISDLDQCIASYHFGLFHVRRDEYAHVHENPCINCGACVQYCPSHLMPNVISRNAEFQNYEECRKLSVAACMDCGLCSYYCIARRPMLQYMREAKKALAVGGGSAN